ncbi:hypothetical protein [Methylococcus sp. EFPC2]|uniref:hypothetical protein n=1 Tax=Methylococcus sp. EFPC2 TaxID=2812648 RepID=UPI001967DD4B|nr:hypothetical protein [Methylococcus sp. EFPC2]QSA96206.1 hypothetical protein JWZ97_13335 [Methylococcus sp. EFPC2]
MTGLVGLFGFALPVSVGAADTLFGDAAADFALSDFSAAACPGGVGAADFPGLFLFTISGVSAVWGRAGFEPVLDVFLTMAP